MDKKIIYLVVALIIILGFGIFLLMGTDQDKEIPQTEELTHEEAELIGFNFMLDFIAIAPPDSDSDAMERVYAALSGSAREQVSPESLVRDMAMFVGVQDVPDEGISVEDLSVINQTQATLVVGLNYSGGRILKNINLVAEQGEWKVDSITERPEESLSLPFHEIPAVKKVINFAQQELDLDQSQITVISVVEQEWPDGCLGLGGFDEMCTTAIVPGYEIVLKTENEQRIYRTDREGDVIREDLGSLE